MFFGGISEEGAEVDEVRCVTDRGGYGYRAELARTGLVGGIEWRIGEKKGGGLTLPPPLGAFLGG